MVNDMNERTQGIYDETGGFMSFCRHGFVLVIIDMVQSGELLASPFVFFRSLY